MSEKTVTKGADALKTVTKPLNLYQKLLLVRKQVQYLQKAASGYQYKYVTESQVLGAIRPKMDELGIMLEVDMMKPEIDGNLLNVGFNFIWVNCDNPEERIEKTMYMQCKAGDPKLLGGLLSYSNRYFLTKTFQIATDELDIDAFQQKMVDTKKVGDERISEEQLEQLSDLINGHSDIREAMVKGYGSLNNIKAKDFNNVCNVVKKRIADKEVKS